MSGDSGETLVNRSIAGRSPVCDTGGQEIARQCIDLLNGCRKVGSCCETSLADLDPHAWLPPRITTNAQL